MGNHIVKCPSCGASYEVDSTMVGKRIACECGFKFDIEVSQNEVSSDVNRCPECGEEIADNAVICISCGYNFKTGTKIQQSVSSESGNSDLEVVEKDSGIYEKIYPFIKPAVILVILIIVSFAAYRIITSKHYGISSSSPIGTFSELTSHFNSIGLSESEKIDVSKALDEEIMMYKYENKKLANKTRSVVNESISLFLDKDKKICAVIALFFASGGAIPIGSRVTGFIKSYWKEIGLKKPVFNNLIERGVKPFTVKKYVFVSSVNNVHGKWVREQDNGTGLIGPLNSVYICNNFSLDKLVNYSLSLSSETSLGVMNFIKGKKKREKE